MTTTTTCPAWCGHWDQLSDGAPVHKGIGYTVTIDGQDGEVVPLIVDGNPVVNADVPTGFLTPGETRELARVLLLIAEMVEDAATPPA